MKATMIVQRVFGRTPDKAKLDQFMDWFINNVEKLEEALDEANPKNGQMLFDYQPETGCFVVEIQTINAEFANESKVKFEELEFADSAMIGDVKSMEVKDETSEQL